jgi:hypothetical protein
VREQSAGRVIQRDPGLVARGFYAKDQHGR